MRTPWRLSSERGAQIDQQYDRKQEYHGDFIEDPIKHVGPIVFTTADAAYVNTGLKVIGHQTHNPTKFSDHPA